MINTVSLFYYGHTVDATNNLIDFNEGASDLIGTLNFGSYSLTEYAAEVARALNAAGDNVYTATLNRTNRKLTIAADHNFSLLGSTGAHPNVSAFSMMGFSGDHTSAATYTGASGSGSVYEPQFLLQDYVDKDHYQKAVDATVITSASGAVEVVKFGLNEFFMLNIRFANNIPQPTSGPITSNLSGVTQLKALMDYLITKAPIEFIPDENSPSTFEKVILESTPDDGKGVGYKLKERTDMMLSGYFDTGVLTMRVVE